MSELSSFKSSCSSMSNLFTTNTTNNSNNFNNVNSNNNNLLASNNIDSSMELFQQKNRDRRKFSVIDDFASLYSSLGYHANTPLGYFGHVNEACSLPFSGCNNSFGSLSNNYNHSINTNLSTQNFSRSNNINSNADRSSGTNISNNSSNSVSG